MLLLRHAQTGGALPPKRRMETAHERLLPNRVAVQHAGAGDSNTANTIAVLYAARSTVTNALMPLRADRLHHADTHVKLCRGSDLALVERVDQLRKFLHSPRRIVPHPVGDNGHPWRLCDRISNVECRSRKLMCIANAHLHQRTALRFIYIRIVHPGRLSYLHTTYSGNENSSLSRGTNRLHHANAYIELRSRRDRSDLERVDQFRQLMHYSDRVLPHPVGDNGHPR